MAKYRKKPVVIEAVPYKYGLEDGATCIPDDSMCMMGDCGNCDKHEPYIKTLEGRMKIKPTDMIITGVKGERYPCDKEIFDMTYDLVEEE